MLNPHEQVSLYDGYIYLMNISYFQVDMPVFFYLDPEIMDDPYLEFVDEITLSYTFFEAKVGLKLPVPAYLK